MMKSWKSAGVAVGLSLLVLAGCSEAESEDAEVRSVVTGFFSDLADGDESACGALTGAATRLASLSAQMANVPATCQEAVKVFSGQLNAEEKKALKDAKVNRVTINGDQATIAPTDVEFPLAGGQSQFFSNIKAGPTQLMKVDGSWKIGSLG
ncbi:MAG: hypothetical protein M3450_04605 [Actinomycetota bacterium]|nr:hypothetical protein [Actinomycetota bacterium]